MATSFQPNVHYSFGSPMSSASLVDSRRVSGILESDNVSSRVYNSVTSRRGSRRLSAEPSNLADVVSSLRRRNSAGMDALVSNKLVNATHATLGEWISAERMNKLPPEGSSYDRVLVWASLFVDRLHSFDLAVEEFAGDSHLAAQLVYGYCMLLLELGEENSSALMVMFGFFCNCSQELVNLLDRAELFSVSQDIKDQLILALADLVTLVVCVATKFHRSLRGIASESVSIDIYTTFAGPIESFRSRCEHVSGLMWRHQLLRDGFDEATVSEIQTIKRWLEPEDPVLASVTQNAAHLAQDREELTCLWMKPYLSRFLKSDKRTLAISGKPGSGKTILSSVMIDHLQYPVGGVTYKPIFVPINSRVRAQTTPRGILKTILSQIFDKRIGNVQLYQILADTYKACCQAVDPEEYDNHLWSALESALQASMRGAKELVLVVDGMDEASCGEQALAQKLKQTTENAENLKLVLLGAHKSSTSEDRTTVNVTPELVFDDIAAVVRHILQDEHSFADMSEEQREMTANRITEAADGSFLWAKLATKQVRGDGSAGPQALLKSVDSLVKAGHTVKDFVSSALQNKTVGEDAKKILSWLTISSRPLSVREIPALLSIQLDKGTITPRDVEPRQILRPVSSLVFFQNGLLYLRHAQVRDAIIDIFSQGQVDPAVKERNIDMARRLLLYTKDSITTEHETSLNPLDPNITEGLLDKHPLLDFALRYWVDYVKNAFGCNTDQEMTNAVKKLRTYMPTSSTVPLLTMTIWQRKATPVQVLMHSIQTQFYQQLLSPKHPTTLQSILCEAVLYRRLYDTMTSKVTWVLYDAVKLCHDVLGPRSIITLHVAQYFIDMTTNEVTDTRSEIMMKRVQVLQVLVECYKMHYGEKSELVISLITQLAEHYHIIQEEDKSREMYALIQESSTNIQTQWTSPRKNDDSLRVNLHGRQMKDVPDLGPSLPLDENEEDELISATVESNETLLTLAETYISQGKIELAESAFIEVWQRTSQEYRMNRSTDLEVKNLQAVLAYARFLQSQNRDDEAASLLASLWQEYDQGAVSSQAAASQFTKVAKMMKNVGLSTMALNVFKHCGQYYESTSGYHSSAYKEIQESIQVTSKEVMQMATRSSSAVTESSLKEMVLDSVNNMDATSIAAANTLIEMYISQRRWHDATSLIKTVLRGIWPQLFAKSVQDVSLPSTHLEYSISLAERLSDCYRSRRRLSKEEDIRHRLYFSLRRARQLGDKTRDRATSSLLRLYQRTSQTDKVIHLHQEMLSDITKHYGAEHPTVIQKLWTLAELTSPRPISVDYYRQIVTIINKNSDICKPEAFEPLLIVVNDLWNKERYTDALQPCKVLFNSLRNPKISPKLRQQDFVRTVFNRYMQCLRVSNADSTVLHDVAVQYRNTCKTLFGEGASITVQSTITLATICQESTQFESEAVQLYESLLTIQSDEIDHDEIRGSLEAINDKQTDIISAEKTESLSTEQLQRVISHRSQRLTTVRSEYGWAHEKSLSEMEEMASLYSRRGELVAVASMLKDATIQVLSNETSSTRLTAAAKSIANSYITSGQVQRGRELTQEIYRQLVIKDTSNVKSVHFNVSTQQRQSLMFLAQLEYSLREDSSVTLNEIFSSLITEYIYFEHFRHAVRSKASNVQSVTSSAARLHGFLLARGRRDTVSFVVDQFAEFILTSEGDSLQISSTSQVREFAVTLLNYFTIHTSPNFIRSVAIASYQRVRQLMRDRQYEAACDLALTSFKFIRAHDGYSYLPTLKLAFKLGMAVSSREQKTRPEGSQRKTMLEVSSVIMKETVHLFKRMKIDITSLGQENLNNLIGLLDEQQDYQSLAWVLTTLWDRREAPGATQPYFIITLARMLIITRYLVGDYMAAMRLAEDIVYNCCRVHGTRHPNTFDMTVLLSQLYTSVAQRYQSQQDGREMAFRYYKKAAALHENGLRAFVDPSSVEIEYGTESGMESDDTSSTPSEALEDEGKHVRQHLHLLKHAVERLGGWPKDFSEYQRLSDEVFKAYPNDLKGVDGVEKWNLKQFGSGKAESTDDMVSTGGVQQRISFNVRDLGGMAIAV